MSITREQKDVLVDCLYEAAVNMNMPDVGNRQEFESIVEEGDSDISLFFLEFARLWATKQPIPVTDVVDGERMVMIPETELTALRDMAWRYQECSK